MTILLVLLFFSNGSHLEFLTQLNFYYSEALESDHAAYEIQDSWRQWFNRICHLNGLKMDLNARVNVTFDRVDINFQTVTVTLFCY